MVSNIHLEIVEHIMCTTFFSEISNLSLFQSLSYHLFNIYSLATKELTKSNKSDTVEL